MMVLSAAPKASIKLNRHCQRLFGCVTRPSRQLRSLQMFLTPFAACKPLRDLAASEVLSHGLSGAHYPAVWRFSVIALYYQLVMNHLNLCCSPTNQERLAAILGLIQRKERQANSSSDMISFHELVGSHSDTCVMLL